MTLERRDWDVCVVGAGPAGAMTAREVARGGASVLLLDRAPFPRRKVCGCCLGPAALAVLRDVGLGDLPGTLGAVPLQTLRLGGWGRQAHLPLEGSVALSRTALDTTLAHAAREAGARFLAPARARLGKADAEARTLEVDVDGEPLTVRARVVVAADGVGSPLLQSAVGSARAARLHPDSRIGFGALFPPGTPGYPPGVIHMAVGPAGYVGAVRLEDGTLDVAAALSPQALGSGRRPEAVVATLLRDAGFTDLPATPSVPWQGTPRLTRSLPTRGAERLLAVGDAAGYVEPFTGEGMGWALAGARTLAPLVLAGAERWSPALVGDWDRRHRATVGAAARMCRGVAWALRRPALSRAGMGLLHRLPSVAAPFVRRAGRIPPLSDGSLS